MKYFQRALTFALCSLVLTLTGCHSALYPQTEDNVADVKDKMAYEKQQMAQKVKTAPPLIVNQGLYVDKTPINLIKQPYWLKNTLVLRGERLPFSYFSRVIAGGANSHVLTRYQVGLDDKLAVSINYTGTVKGALDALAARSGYVYTINGNNIYWQAFVTKTFDIAFMPGESDYLMGKAAGGGSVSTVGGGSGGGASVSATIDDSAASQYSSLKGTISLWKDLQNSVKQMLTKEGKVVVSQSTTSLTVRDRPTNVALVGQYITSLNQNLSRQVLVKVQVLSVSLESDFNYGINWNAVKHALGGYFQLNQQGGQPISLSASPLQLNIGNAATPGFNNLVNATDTGKTGIYALINALQMQGKVSVVNQPQLLCQNDQVSSLRILSSAGYLASIQTTTLAGTGTTGGTSGVTSQLTPGTLVTGMTLYVLPKIIGDKVYLQINADLSSNLGFQTITSNGQSVQENLNKSITASAIQVPNTTQKLFNQRSLVRSGDTLILAGFRQLNNTAGASQFLNSQALGGKTASQYSTETIVLITPIVLHGLA